MIFDFCSGSGNKNPGSGYPIKCFLDLLGCADPRSLRVPWRRHSDYRFGWQRQSNAHVLSSAQQRDGVPPGLKVIIGQEVGGGIGSFFQWQIH